MKIVELEIEFVRGIRTFSCPSLVDARAGRILSDFCPKCRN